MYKIGAKALFRNIIYWLVTMIKSFVLKNHHQIVQIKA